MEGIEEYTDFVKSLYKEINVPMNFRNQTYNYFNSKFRKESGFSTDLTYEEFENGMAQMLKLRTQTLDMLLNTKLFILNKAVAKLLYLTNNKIFKREIPFNNFFLETSFELENGSIVKGIHIFKEPKEGVILGVVRIYDERSPIPITCHFDLFSEHHEKMNTENKVIDLQQKEGGIGVLKDKKIQLFICNFLDFLNNPEIETRTIKWVNNENRIRKGKFPIPDKIIINLKNKLYRYVYEDIPKQSHSLPSYSFWVRGHYIHFWNKKRWKRLYKLNKLDLNEKGYQVDEKGIISKWKLPFIKGKGILVEKKYKIKIK